MDFIGLVVYAPIAACALLAVYMLGGVSGLVITGLCLLVKFLSDRYPH